jgi:hypothetical protein
MAREFNFQKAWEEIAKPNYDQLPQVFKDAYQLVATKYRDLRQNPDLDVDLPDDVRELVSGQTTLQIAIAAHTIYFWGHWGHCTKATVHYPGVAPKEIEADMWLESAIKDYIKLMNEYGEPSGEIRTERHHNGPTDGTGAYWKVAKMLDRILRERLKNVDHSASIREGVIRLSDERKFWATEEWRSCPLSCQGANWGKVGERYNLHKAGTPWELADLPERYQALVVDDFEIVQGMTVNHKPHPFVIGPQHFPKGGGLFLGENEMRQAPCAYRERGGYRCDLMYDQHTSDRALLLKAKRNLTNKEAAATLFKLKEAIAANGDKIDGFAFVKSEFTIAPPEDTGGHDPKKED